MTAYLGNLAQFNVDGDNWKIYQEQLEQFLEVNEIKNDLKKLAFLSCIGPDAYKLLRDLCTPNLPKEKTFEELCLLMDNHFTPKINIFRERNNFYAASQQEGESIADFTARLRNLSANCNFGINLESILIDKFVFGLKSGKIKDKICEEKPTEETTLSQIVDIALTKETYLVNEGGQTQGQFQWTGNRMHSRGKDQGGGTVSRVNQCRVCGKRHTDIQNCAAAAAISTIIDSNISKKFKYDEKLTTKLSVEKKKKKKKVKKTIPVTNCELNTNASSENHRQQWTTVAHKECSEYLPDNVKIKIKEDDEEEVCSKSFNNPSFPVDHKKYLYICKICNKKFNYASSLQLHEHRHAADAASNTGEINSLKCNVCSKTFKQNSHLCAHYWKHTSEKPFVCHFCGMAFKRYNYLVVHYRKHTGEKQFECEFCNNKFSQKTDMIIHRRKHTGQRPYTCSECNSKFSSSATLLVHKRTHSGHRPYTCKVCGSSFTQSHVLLEHSRVHTGERPYSCDICGLTFVTYGGLRKHTMRKHIEHKKHIKHLMI